MSSATLRFKPDSGNQNQFCSLAKNPISSIPASMTGTDHNASSTVPDITSNDFPRCVAARTPIAIATI